MADSTLAQNLLDHAGSYYEWFSSVRIEGTSIVLEADTDLAEESELRLRATLSTSDIRAALTTLDADWDGQLYQGRFFRDMLAEKWDDADGDMDAVDAVLQMALWGELVFG